MTYPNTVISMPSQLFTMRSSFKAVANGSVYIGEVDTDPTIPTNQIQVYIEQENGTLVPVAQPIKINSAGLLTASGQVQKFVLTNTEYSMTVQNSYDVDEFYFPRIYDQGISAALEVENRLLGPGTKIYRGSNGQYVQDGDQVPLGTTHLIAENSGIVSIQPKASGIISGISSSGALIDSTTVYFQPLNSSPPLQRVTDAPILSGVVVYGQRIEWMGYYEPSDGGSNWGIVKTGAHNEDGLSIFSIDANTYIEANLKGRSVNVRKGGAKGDDVTDDYAALSKVIDYAETSGIKKVKWPDGSYRTSDQLVFNHETIWLGCGASTVIKPTAALTGKAVVKNTQVVNGLWSGYQSIKDICIVNDTSVADTRGLEFVGAVWEWELNNVHVEGFGLAGMKFERCYRGRVINPGIYSCGQGGSEAALDLAYSPSDRNSNIRFSGGNIQDTPENLFACRIDSAVNITFDMVTFQSNGRGINAKGTTNLVVRDCYMEDLDREMWLQIGSNGARCKQTKVENTLMIRNTYQLPILLEGDEDTILDNVRGIGSNVTYISRNSESRRSKIINSRGLHYADTKASFNHVDVIDDNFFIKNIDENVWTKAGDGTVGINAQPGGQLAISTLGATNSNQAIQTGFIAPIYASENPVFEVVAALSTLSSVNYKPVEITSGASYIRISAANGVNGVNFVLYTSDGVDTNTIPLSLVCDTNIHCFRVEIMTDSVVVTIDGKDAVEVTTGIPLTGLTFGSQIIANENSNKSMNLYSVKLSKDFNRIS
ncbi:hypothetical protein GAW91_000126 [Vibrio fluvialis]|nr:hypothetical protein [Vibrio fluvialis]